MAISVVSFSFSRAAQPEARGTSSQLDAGFLYRILLPTGLVSKLTDFLSSPSYIIVQSPTQYLPITGHWDVSLQLSLGWHVWLSSSGKNCHAVHRSLSSGASVYDCTMWFYLVPYCQPSPPTPVEYVFGMACLAGSKINIQHCALHVLLVSLGWFVRWEVDNRTTTVVWGAASRICSKQDADFFKIPTQILFTYHFLLYIRYFIPLLASSTNVTVYNQNSCNDEILTAFCTATYHQSRKLSKLDESDIQDTAEEVGMSS